MKWQLLISCTKLAANVSYFEKRDKTVPKLSLNILYVETLRLSLSLPHLCRSCLWVSPPSLCVLWVSIVSMLPPPHPNQRLGRWSAAAPCCWSCWWCGSPLCCCPALKSSSGSSASPCPRPLAGLSTPALSPPPLLCPSTCLTPSTLCCSGITRWEDTHRLNWATRRCEWIQPIKSLMWCVNVYITVLLLSLNSTMFETQATSSMRQL